MKFAKLIKEICDLNYYSVEFYNGYSGRGMYGKKCVGITGQTEGCRFVIAEVIKEAHNTKDADFEELVDTILNFSQDSMGRDVILYWSDIAAIEEE